MLLMKNDVNITAYLNGNLGAGGKWLFGVLIMNRLQAKNMPFY
jgi:hypothetical protein